MSHRQGKRPTTPKDVSYVTPSHHDFSVQDGPAMTSAFLGLGTQGQHPGDDHPTLSLISTQHQNYVGYRDGKGSQADNLAIGVEPDGSVFLQVVLPGDGPESSRVKEIPLDQVYRFAALMP